MEAVSVPKGDFSSQALAYLFNLQAPPCTAMGDPKQLVFLV